MMAINEIKDLPIAPSPRRGNKCVPPMCETSQTANETLVLNDALNRTVSKSDDTVKQRNVIMSGTVISLPRSKETLTKLVRNILGDIVAIATTLDEIFDECSPERVDEMKRRLEFIQAEVEAIKAFSPREPVGWITG